MDPSIYESIWLYILIHLSPYYIYLTELCLDLCPSVYIYIHLYIYWSVYLSLSVYRSIRSIHLLIDLLPDCLPGCLACFPALIGWTDGSISLSGIECPIQSRLVQSYAISYIQHHIFFAGEITIFRAKLNLCIVRTTDLRGMGGRKLQCNAVLHRSTVKRSERRMAIEACYAAKKKISMYVCMYVCIIYIRILFIYLSIYIFIYV